MEADQERALGFGVEGDDEGLVPADFDEGRSLAYVVGRVVLSMVPFGGTADLVIDAARQRTAEKVQRTVDEVRQVVGEETLLRRVQGNPEVQAVFVQGIEAAARTGYEAKRRALARVVAAAATDDAKVDESLLFVLALRDLDAPHIRALARLDCVEKEAGQSAEAREILDAGGNPYDVTMRAVSDASNDESISVIAQLRRTGCLRGAAFAFSGGDGAGGVSDFGRALLTHLRKGGAPA